jgi:hypothetical protein
MTTEFERPILWVHGDALSPEHPIFRAYPQAPAIFCFDEALLREGQVSLQRIAFLYECLLELPVDIHRGDVVEQVLAFARQHDADGIVTAATPSPRFAAFCTQLDEHLPVRIVAPEAFLDYDGHLDLKRFSRYWKTAQRYAWGDAEG